MHKKPALWLILHIKLVCFLLEFVWSVFPQAREKLKTITNSNY